MPQSSTESAKLWGIFYLYDKILQEINNVLLWAATPEQTIRFVYFTSCTVIPGTAMRE